jgi:hypothetical protein
LDLRNREPRQDAAINAYISGKLAKKAVAERPSD